MRRIEFVLRIVSVHNFTYDSNVSETSTVQPTCTWYRDPETGSALTLNHHEKLKLNTISFLY